ncbi:MAG: Unknown protein [uncultured Sulfurovum sp.]|uniref:Uncharacterized protein n=1 Tax=uncultured Sulfurovum sp. TaxID=269237 RepID=A0A6S6S152_9BACT|nr:MAG: Unknown protein [uncultured Sulfurovum sp.]
MEQNSKYNKKILVNRYPYWLFWNYETVAYIEDSEMKLETEYKQTKFSKTSGYQVFLIKYVPFILMIFFFMKIPQSEDELIISCMVVLYMGVGYIAYKHSTFMVKLLLGLTLLGFYMALFKFDASGRTMNVIVSWFLKIYIVVFILYDFFIHGYRDYFYLDEIIESGHITISKFKKRPALRVPFTKKHLLQIPTGFNAGFNYSFGGYFFKIVEKKKLNNE